MQTETKPEPIVRCFEPTAAWFHAMTRIGNMFVRPLLRSSAGKGIHELALLCFEGRRSGRRYEVPVEYHELDADPHGERMEAQPPGRGGCRAGDRRAPP